MSWPIAKSSSVEEEEEETMSALDTWSWGRHGCRDCGVELDDLNIQLCRRWYCAAVTTTTPIGGTAPASSPASSDEKRDIERLSLRLADE